MKDVVADIELFAFIEDEIVLALEEGRNGKAQNLKSTRNSLRKFLRADRLPITELTRELMVAYERWLKRRGVTRNSSSFYLRQLRSLYNKAELPEFIGREYPFKHVYTGVDETRKRAVDKSVISRLISLDLSQHSPLALARDLFVLSFYMRGIAFVDMAFLRKENIYQGEIRYLRRKTGTPMRIRMEACIQEIFKSYARGTRHGYLLPIITSANATEAYRQYRNKRSYYNKMLKKLSLMMGLPIPLTSYVSRHTWATVARDLNVALPVISAGMGHSSEMTTRIYLASLDTSKIDLVNARIINRINGKVRKRHTK